ncbi:MAG: hypothetical protein GY913_03475 [Proteobacteria bacterium]|nr:hypothetical protein [Pseudomonadota bacterium]
MWFLLACGPLPPTVELGPEAPNTGDRLLVRISHLDVDEHGDPVDHEFTWFVDGELFDGADEDVGPGSTTKGEHWEVVVNAVGGRRTASDSALIVNAVPGVEVLLEATTTTDLDVTAYLYEDDLDGDELTYDIVWTVDDVATDQTGTTVPASATSAGETWTITVTPDDGEDVGDPVSASIAVG